MDKTEQFILSGKLNKSSKNESMSLNTIISGNRKLLPDNGVSTSIDLYNEYVRERSSSNKFRLFININPYCSNVLFNPFTEIVKYDIDENGNTKNTFLNFNIITTNYDEDDESTDVNIKSLSGDVVVEEAIGKDKFDDECVDLKTFVPCSKRFDSNGKFKWTAYDAIRDTQLSNKKCGFQYYCGLDIFNNHILRNKTFKTLNYTELSENKIACYDECYGELGYKDIYVQENKASHRYLIAENFNTIDDYMRDKNGVVVSDFLLVHNKYWVDADSIETSVPLHIYQNYDVLSFNDCVKLKLIEKNGWFGFNNASTFDSLSLNEKSDGSSTVFSKEFSINPPKIEMRDGCDDTIEKTLTINLGEYSAKNQDGKSLNINKVINNRGYGDFIDMYPSRELYSFTPLFNDRYKRFEKNWYYCLTYPKKSIKFDFMGNKFPFFYYLPDDTISMKTVMFDEYTVDDDGRAVVTIYSIVQHGLKKGDNVNIYKGDELFYDNGTVVRIVDKYIFQIYKDSANISNKFINIDEIEWDNMGMSKVDDIAIEKHDYYVTYKGKNYAITHSNRCNIDDTAQVVSFKRVVNKVECEYYVRVFSRLPNFKFVDAEVNDYNLYEDTSLDLINRYSKPGDNKSEFENHISDMSFAQTAYGDRATEIVYTDDIDISYLKDNLGRPLSEIYFTIFKNNKGYKKWYKNQISFEYGPNIDHFRDIEFSHCFGYISSSFLLNQSYRWFNDNSSDNKISLKDVRDISAQNNAGLRYHQHFKENDYFDDEMRFEEITDYYGDICYYSPVECDEYSLQSVMARFNTVQREMIYYPEFNDKSTDEYKRYSTYFNSFYNENIINNGVLLHDEIIDSDLDVQSKETAGHMFENFNEKNSTVSNYIDLHHSSFNYDDKKHYVYNDMQSLKEGYYYKMHYKIPLKTVSRSISSDEAINYEIFSIENVDGALKIQTSKSNDLTLNDKLTLYNKTKNKFYYLTVSKIYTECYFECSVKNEDLSSGFKDEIDFVDEVSLVKRNLGTPEYAKLIKDGSCRYYWRNIISNGIEENDSKVYPFTNGAFYVDRRINFFLRRQDPHGENLSVGSNRMFTFETKGEKLSENYYDNIYYDSEEIETC